MPLLRAVPVMLSAGERTALKKRVRGAKTAYRDRLRAQIVLAAARGHPNARIAAGLGISVDTVRKWRGRFAARGLAPVRKTGAEQDTAQEGAWCTVRDMEGLLASVVIAILLGVLLVVVFDVFCLLRLGTTDTAHFLPKFVWAVLVVCTSPIGGLVFLLAQRLPKRSPEPVSMRTRPLLGRKAWFGPARGGYGPSPASPEGHAVGVVAMAAAVYLGLAGQVLAAVVVLAVLVITVFLKGTPPGGAREWKEFQARRYQRPRAPGH